MLLSYIFVVVSMLSIIVNSKLGDLDYLGKDYKGVSRIRSRCPNFVLLSNIGINMIM